MRIRPLSENAATSLQALLILVAFVVLLIVVPHRWLRPLAVGFVVFAVLAVVGIRFYLRRLEGAVRAIEFSREAHPDFLLAALLSARERQLLGLRSQRTSIEIVETLRRRQANLFALAMWVAIPGICAFLLVLFFFSD